MFSDNQITVTRFHVFLAGMTFPIRNVSSFGVRVSQRSILPILFSVLFAMTFAAAWAVASSTIGQTAAVAGLAAPALACAAFYLLRRPLQFVTVRGCGGEAAQMVTKDADRVSKVCLALLAATSHGSR
jgi:hypothetical protein